MQPRHLALMLFVCVIWGFNFVAAKYGLRELPPLLFTAIRFSILALLLAPFLKYEPGRMRDITAIALFNGAIHFALMFTGIALTAASVVAVVVQLNVPFATLLSIVFLGEVVNWRRWFGIALTFVGVMIVSFDPHVFESVTGVLFAGAAALSGATATIFMRRLTKVGVLQLQSWTATITAPLLIAATLIFERGQLDYITQAQPMTWVALIFTTIGASLIGHSAWYYLLQRYEVSLLAPLSLIAPILGVVFGITTLGEPLSARIVLGAVTAFAGVAVLAMPSRKRSTVEA